MTTRPLPTVHPEPAHRRSQCAAVHRRRPARREYRERDFGVGYGRSSGYASDRRYASAWNGPSHFRCV